MKIRMCLGKNSYTIHLVRGGLSRVGEYFSLSRRVMIVTDDGVPAAYARAVANAAKEPYIVTLKAGEASKSLENYKYILSVMLEKGFDRGDAVVAVGGGVVGDLSGFVASSYMRGVDFYNVPTTVLSAVDASVGGKTAVDFMGYKNIVGAFYQPKAVLIDADTFATLPPRQVSNGLAESLKMAIIADAELFTLIEKGDIEKNMNKILFHSIRVKKRIVEADEREIGLRKLLNLGHTLGHGIESVSEPSEYHHGECVALGMLPLCSAKLRERLFPIYEKLHLPTSFDGDIDGAIELSAHDKKRSGAGICIISADDVGICEIRTIGFDEWRQRIKTALEEMK